MCLCWNDDGTMCTDNTEISRRIKACMKGEFRPEINKWRKKSMEKGSQEVKTRLTLERIAELKNDICKGWIS